MYNKYTIFAIMAILISATFTILLMTSDAQTIIDLYLFLGMAIVLEGAKAFFLVEGLTSIELGKSGKAVMLFIFSLLLLYSICASSAKLLNNANMSENQAYLASKSYQDITGQEKLNKSLLDEYRGEKRNVNEQYKTSKESIIEKAKNDVDKQNKWIAQANHDYWVTKNCNDKIDGIRSSESADLKRLEESYRKDLDRVNDKIDEYTEKVENPVEFTARILSTENGYTDFYNSASEVLGVEPKNFKFWFLLGLTILFEISAVIFVYLHKIKPKKTLTQLLIGKDIGGFQPFKKKSKIDLIESNIPNPIKPKVDVQNVLAEKLRTKFTDENLKKYKGAMIESKADDGTVSGYQKIARQTKIKQTEAQYIRQYLEMIGVIRTENKITKLV